MALNNLQERVERSIFEELRKLLVAEGYLPNITNYTMGSPSSTAQYHAALEAIVTAKKFAAEVFGHSSSQEKGIKRVPRIAIIPRRILPGDTGAPPEGYITEDPLDPDNFVKIVTSAEAANFQLDIHLVSSTAVQDRFLNAILSKAIGQKRYLKFYDDPTQRFFIKQYNYYDLPDTMEGVEEKVYSYEVSDLYLYEEIVNNRIVPTIEITMNTTLLALETKFTADGHLIGPFENDGSLFIDLSGIKIVL